MPLRAAPPHCAAGAVTRSAATRSIPRSWSVPGPTWCWHTSRRSGRWRRCSASTARTRRSRSPMTPNPVSRLLLHARHRARLARCGSAGVRPRTRPCHGPCRHRLSRRACSHCDRSSGSPLPTWRALWPACCRHRRPTRCGSRRARASCGAATPQRTRLSWVALLRALPLKSVSGLRPAGVSGPLPSLDTKLW